MTPPASYKVTVACRCGAALTGTAATLEDTVGLAKLFWTLHDGSGHGAATLAQARNARRQAERAFHREQKVGR